ncbi:MAG: hypothetical protein DRJ07_07080 [Bacteroidetes bacterium]|nr:MAG: hypothetical protein DRI73_03320 [Bacteroidota bacterium]RLD83213.1 MAG: hypothetical protein DRJ07_07080 [Bacteroidota bacterium]
MAGYGVIPVMGHANKCKNKISLFENSRELPFDNTQVTKFAIFCFLGQQKQKEPPETKIIKMKGKTHIKLLPHTFRLQFW